MSQPSDGVQKKGIISKCPSCGAQVGAFASVCESCGHEFSEIDANRTITALVDRFEEIEREVEELKLGNKGREQVILEKRARVIRDFPMPNSREDLQQLIYYIQPKVMDTVKPDPNIEDWKAKFTEVLNRAKNAYKNDSRALAEFEAIVQGLNTSLAENLQVKAKRNPLFFALLGGVFLLALIVGINSFIEKTKLRHCEEAYSDGSQKERDRLDRLFASVEQGYKSKNYTEALAAVAQVRWTYEATECKIDINNKAKAEWDDKRVEMASLIQKDADADAAEKQASVEREAYQQQAEADRKAAEKQAELDRAAAEKEAAAKLAAQKEHSKAVNAAIQERKASLEKQW